MKLDMHKCTNIYVLTAVVMFNVFAINIQASVLYVDQNNLNANDASGGAKENPFKTIHAAAQVARKGDTVLVYPGIYREHIIPHAKGSGVSYISAKRHQAIVKGSDVWQPQWSKVQGQAGVVIALLDSSLFEGKVNPYCRTISISGKDVSQAARPIDEKETHWPITLGQLFVDSQPMTQVTTMAEVYDLPGTWIVGKEGKTITLHFPKYLKKISQALVELTVRDRVFASMRRGLKNITIDGFIMEHCANQGPFPQSGIISVRSGSGWMIRDNIIRYAKTIGLDIGSETWGAKTIPYTDDDQKKIMIGGRHQIIGNIVEDNGLSGIAGWHCSGSLIKGNIVRRNNRLGFESKINARWEEAAGIKVHSFNSGIIEGNLVVDNHAAGIWIDNGYRDARISRNFVTGSLGKGIFVELGEGTCTIDHNIVSYTRNYSPFYAGDGIYSHDASDLIIANNLLYHNARYGVLGQVVSGRTLGKDKRPVETSNHKIVNNIFIGNNKAAISMPYPSKQAQNNISDYNVIIGKSAKLQIHRNKGRVSSERMVEVYSNAFDAMKIPQQQRWNLALGVDKIIDLATWQHIMKQDEHTIVAPDCRMIVSPGNAVFTVMNAGSTWSVLSPPVDRVTKDYWGRLIVDDANYAGPFGKIKPGFNRWTLWPIK